MSNANKDLQQLKTQLEVLPMAELRKRAVQHFGLKLSREMTKEDVLTMVIGEVAKRNYAGIADGDLRPGYARIKLQKVGWRSSFPAYINANGYECFIPYNINVDVPLRVLESLDHAEEFTVSDGVEDGSYEIKQSYVQSYPYQLIERCEGPDPKPGIEIQREQKLKPKYLFREQFGFWPTDKVMKDYMQAGMFRFTAKELADVRNVE